MSTKNYLSRFWKKMKIKKMFARFVVYSSLVFQRVKMIMIKPAFSWYGKNFIFEPNGFYNFENIEVGNDVSIGDFSVFLASDSKIIIGNKVMFGPRVTVVGGNHNTDVLGKFMYDVHEKRPGDDLGVIFEDDIWVGSGAIILNGVKVGRGSIIAAGAVVNKNVPPYSIFGGIPARKISTRFGEIQTILDHEKALYPEEKRLSIVEINEIFSN